MEGLDIEELKQLARRECAFAEIDNWTDFDIQDFCGGNFDDVFSFGVDTGETLLARKILTSIGISWDD